MYQRARSYCRLAPATPYLRADWVNKQFLIAQKYSQELPAEHGLAELPDQVERYKYFDCNGYRSIVYGK